MEVAVVGGGIHGVSAARRLAEAGHRTVLFEPASIPNPLGSSGGAPGRIVRRAYPDAHHTALMTEAYPLWRELERASGRTLLHEVGLLAFGPREGAYVGGLAAALAAQGVAHDPEPDVAALMPGLRMGRDEGAVFVPEAGWVDSGAAVEATYRLALDAGAEHVPERASGLERFDRVAVCAGPWVRDFWPDAPVRMTVQATAWQDRPPGGPVWIEDGPSLLYGLPSDGPQAKIGVHRAGPEFDPRASERPVAPWMRAAVEGFARGRYGRGVETSEPTPCLYATTPDERFRLHRLDARTLVVSACSGHGFKFGPWVGARVAALLA